MRDLYRPRGGRSRLTWRKLDALIEWLPGESATKTAIRDALGDDKLAELAAQPRDGHGRWTHEALQLAAIQDGVNHLTWLTLRLQRPESRITPPEPVRRPGVAGKRRHKATPEQRAYLQYLREHRGQLPPGMKFVRAR